MLIGEEKILTWNTAKDTGDELRSGESVRIEAFEVDWIVLRAGNGRAYTADFTCRKGLIDFYNNLDGYEEG